MLTVHNFEITHHSLRAWSSRRTHQILQLLAFLIVQFNVFNNTSVKNAKKR